MASCPFCGYRKREAYLVQLHVEEQHTDDSPFVAQDTASENLSKTSPGLENESTSSRSFIDEWTRCTRKACGEIVLLCDIDEHLHLHAAEELQAQENGIEPQFDLWEPLHAQDEGRPRAPPITPPKRSCKNPDERASRRSDPHSPRRNTASSPRQSVFSCFFASSSSSSSSSSHTRSSSNRLPPPLKPGRLGTRELGPHAFEKSMPDAVRRALLPSASPQHVNRISRGGRLIRTPLPPANETPGLIPVLADLFALLPSTTQATHLCHPSTRHVHKLPAEGNFCGYWSIQTLLTYLQHLSPARHRATPAVPEMQAIIEAAWARGICAYGKVETGGILGTRKWIGTHEALAFFTGVGVEVDALSFQSADLPNAKSAVEQLLDHVEAYFLSAPSASTTRHGTSVTTALPPIYFQRHGHSMAIVGLERLLSGQRNLLVFDSSFATAGAMGRLLGGGPARGRVEELVRVYRRSEGSLGRWGEFEVVVPRVSAADEGMRHGERVGRMDAERGRDGRRDGGSAGRDREGEWIGRRTGDERVSR